MKFSCLLLIQELLLLVTSESMYTKYWFTNNLATKTSLNSIYRTTSHLGNIWPRIKISKPFTIVFYISSNIMLHT